MLHRPICRALLSVSDKTGIIEFARALHVRNVELLTTGGTAELLLNAGIPVIEVSDFTGFPEVMNGRVKTLHPVIHGGILARRDTDEKVMKAHDIKPIDLVVVNLYPFANTIKDPNCTRTNVIENIDIGGPTLIRAAAKNHAHVSVVVDANDYDAVITEMDINTNATTLDSRFHWAVKAFEHTANYDGMIANYFGQFVPPYHDTAKETDKPEVFPRTLTLHYIKKQNMRYGENGHQQAAFYIEPHCDEPSVSTATQLAGKTLSYNNIADTDAALECVKEFPKPACVIVKHSNPCGVAMHDTPLKAYLYAYQSDPTSAFGGIIAFNRSLDEDTARAIIERQFVEVIIAPGITETALRILKTKPNIRVLSCGSFKSRMATLDTKKVTGGLLVQDRDIGMITPEAFTVVSRRKPSEQEQFDAHFCWKVAKYVKSNAIVYAKNAMTLGIGAGQMSRVYSAKIAGLKALEERRILSGCVMASDAFFPFRDGIDTAAEAGVSCIIQPGGSIRDDEIISAANEHNIAMIFTGMRHFRH